ncbi:UDP-glucose dehydrogenase family protein [Silvibacterium dinghuense]|uniref:UDP-glucose 6-dehydrogenase n=1 Tax=Silvibacterium dinghuense TaxID=1560006 RepID=A0A4Q1S878_9BACT|nr:UDP-glucose/GDP-mannose dehydrogenase family protein [Silvibacterium dinghuense]RXS93043.1 UDP-glucose/GDP-mannose dehydrogenase family protein [Silvibacterium dinghuense]GGG89918.1 UDP-glucose 6-dehydrogenase [Silvibacterium dinghuense]
MSQPVSIAVVGSGYVGLVAAACFAEIGHKVICVDNDESKVKMLREGGVPIHEEYLPELLARHRGTNIEFTSDLRSATKRAQAIFIAVGTPQSKTGSADLSYVDAVASEIARSIDDYKVIVEKSTVPVYTNEWIRRVVERNGVARELFDVASNPEFLREGTAVVDFIHADRIVIGVENDKAGQVLRDIYAPLTSGEYFKLDHAVPGDLTADTPPALLQTSTKAAELIKHASNAFLAMKISFINVVSNVCEAVGADVEQVSKGMGMDSRIGPKFLKAGIGYGGSCFPKDVAAFRYVAEQLGVDFDLLKEVEEINEEQKSRFFQKVRSALWTFRSKKVGVLGLAFKGGTDDIRESPALDIVHSLLKEGCSVVAFDPAAIDRTKEVIPPSEKMQYVNDAYAAAQDADALLILTDWHEFAELDLAKLHYTLRYPIIIDGRNLYDPAQMIEAGFTYLSVGRPAAQQTRDTAVWHRLP